MMSSTFRFSAALIAILSSCQPPGSLPMAAEEPSPFSSASVNAAVMPVQPAIDLSMSPVVSSYSSQSSKNALTLLSSSGERVVFSKTKGSWYAETSLGRLPVVGSKDQPSIDTYVSWLSGQGQSVMRSRLHIIPRAASPTGSASVYLGRLGLFGGVPENRRVAWYRGPHIVLSRNDVRTEVYYMPLPAGYCCWGYRCLPGSIVRRANCTLYYVEADSEEALSGLERYQDDRVLEERLATDFAHVVNFGQLLEAGLRMPMRDRQDGHVSRFTHAALVVHANTNKNELSRREGRVDVQLGIAVELVPLPMHAVAITPSPKPHRPPKIRRQAHIPLEAFGAQLWKDYFGVEVDAEPFLPSDIEDLLNSKAPFLLEGEVCRQRVRDNHLLTLIPSSVNGEAFTLDKLGELVLPYFPWNNKNDMGKNAHGYSDYSEALSRQHRTESLSGSAYWLLLPKAILADSRGKSFPAQKAMVAAYSSRGYRLPYALEAAASILTHYARSKERFYGDAPWTYARCLGQDNDGNPLSFGGFSSPGLDISYSLSVYHDGVSCSRKL